MVAFFTVHTIKNDNFVDITYLIVVYATFIPEMQPL